MEKFLRKPRLNPAALVLATALAVNVPLGFEMLIQAASAQTPNSSTLANSTIKALQEALNKQGIPVKTDGVLNDETRNAIKKFQSQHHLPVTGEADKATLNKLGVVVQLGSEAGSSAVGQTASPSTQSPQAQVQPGQGPRGMMSGPMMQPGQGPTGMMSGPIMQNMMQGMMQTMQGMMGMMQSHMHSGSEPMQSGRMHEGPMQAPPGGTVMNCPMMTRSDQPSATAMMQMMQGMMQMMQMMQTQTQSGQNSQGAQ